MIGLVAVKAEADHTILSPRSGQLSEFEGFRWSTIAVGSNDEPKADAVFVRCRSAGVEHDVNNFALGAEASANQSWPHRRLDPHGPLPGTVFDDLAYQAAEVLLRPQRLPSGGDRVREGCEGPVARRHGSRDPAELSELVERRSTHRSVEVEMQVSLRQLGQLPHEQGSVRRPITPVNSRVDSTARRC